MNILKSNKLNFILLFFIFITMSVSAQVKKQKVDGVIGVVGDYVILDSDIDKSYLELKSQNIDITNFEESINIFKEGFAKNYDLASRQFKTAIEEIDKTMDHLQKTKDALLSSVNNLRLANKKEGGQKYR